MNPRLLRRGGGLVAIGVLCSCLAHGAILFSDLFDRPDGLVTNEYAFFNPNDPQALISQDWEMDSGSFFLKKGSGWTGVPDDREPNADSSEGTHSAVFRLDTRRCDFGDVEVSLLLSNQGLISTPTTPPVDWDGVHIWLRYQSQYHLYYCSINRRDNVVVFKKKVPGGSSNGGTYYELSRFIPYSVPYGKWQDVKVTVQNDPDGSVSMKLFLSGQLILSATDDGSLGGPPIRSPGKIGIRGDNANLMFRKFIVRSLETPPTDHPVILRTPH